MSTISIENQTTSNRNHQWSQVEMHMEQWDYNIDATHLFFSNISTHHNLLVFSMSSMYFLLNVSIVHSNWMSSNWNGKFNSKDVKILSKFMFEPKKNSSQKMLVVTIFGWKILFLQLKFYIKNKKKSNILEWKFLS